MTQLWFLIVTEQSSIEGSSKDNLISQPLLVTIWRLNIVNNKNSSSSFFDMKRLKRFLKNEIECGISMLTK